MSSSTYLKYIPTIFANPVANAIALTFIPGVLYVGAAYGHLLIAGATLLTSILVSVLFATLEYVVRVPLVKYSSEVAGMQNDSLQMVWVVVTMILSWLSKYFMPVKV